MFDLVSDTKTPHKDIFANMERSLLPGWMYMAIGEHSAGLGSTAPTGYDILLIHLLCFRKSSRKQRSGLL